MDQASSPHVHAGSLATNKLHGINESLLIGLKTKSPDDSSSVTSMSSSLRATTCMACKKEEVPFSKILVPCIRCKWKIHQGCTSPPISDVKAPYTCLKCTNDQAKENKKKIASAFSDSSTSTKFTAISYTSPYGHSKPGPKSVISESTKISPKVSTMKPGIRCEVNGCDNSMFAVPSGHRPLCQKHRIAQQHAAAKAAPPKPVPVPRSIDKSKLHTVKPDDKPFLKKPDDNLKRKRPAAKRSSSGPQQEMGQGLTSNFTSQLPEQNLDFTFRSPRPLQISPTLSRMLARTVPNRTPEHTEPRKNLAKSPDEVEKDVDNLWRSLGSTKMAETPVEISSAWQGNMFSRSNSARANFQAPAQDSPDYSPPPPDMIENGNAWTGTEDRDESPGSQIAQELAATASQQDAMDQSSLELGRAGLPSIEEDIATSNLRGHSYKPPQVRDQWEEDDDMLDADSQALVDRLASEHPSSSPGKSASPPAQRPRSSTYSDNVSSDGGEAREEPDPTPDPFPSRDLPVESSNTAIPPNSIEEIRAQRAANFDTSELDSYLFKQAQPQSEEQPTNKELLSTQVWGHIDPRVAWPRRMTEEERQEKIKEIEARGGKKANFGKILTAQVRKERAEKGWNIHQTSDWRSEEECKEMDRRVEELFGIEGLGHCVPGIRNRRLVMIEQLEPEELQTGPGRRRKRREPRIFPVMGGQ